MNNTQAMLRNVLQSAQTAATLTEIGRWLHTSQPNISKIITDAEKKYQVRLVNRNQTPVSLTSAGSYLLSQLDQLTSMENQMMEKLRDFNNDSERTIKVAFFPTYAPIIVPQIFPQFVSRHLALKTKSLTTGKALAALKNGDVDIFIGRNASNPNTVSLPLFNEQLCFVVAQNSPLYHAGKFCRQLTAQELLMIQQENYISWQTETSFTSVCEHFMELNDLHFSSKLYLATYEEAMLCAAQGLGTTMAMVRTANFYLHNAAVNLLTIPPEMATLKVSLMYHADTSPSLAKLAKELQRQLVGD